MSKPLDPLLPFWRDLPRDYLHAIVSSDRDNLLLVLLFGAVGLGSIFLLRRACQPMGSTYWIASFLPFGGSSLLGIHQFDAVINGILYGTIPGTIWSGDLVMESILTIHFGLVISGLLCLVVLYFYLRNFMLVKYFASSVPVISSATLRGDG